MVMVSRREAVAFCREVLQIPAAACPTAASPRSEQLAFLDQYARQFTRRVPFTNAFDNFFMQQNNTSWAQSASTDNQVFPAQTPFLGIMLGKHGATCNLAAVFTKCVLEQMGVTCSPVVAKVHLFPLPSIHTMVLVSLGGKEYLIDLGNRLTPNPRLVPLDLAPGQRSEVAEAGDTYTCMERVDQHTFRRHVGWTLDAHGNLADGGRLFCQFTNTPINLYNENACVVDFRGLYTRAVEMGVPVDMLNHYWDHNVPVCGFNQQGVIVRAINNHIAVQCEPGVNKPWTEYKLRSYSDYCALLFSHFPMLDNPDFHSYMTRFWQRRYGSL